MTADEIDRQRARWHGARDEMGLADPPAEDFGRNGLARCSPAVHIRFLILPADPQATLIQFDTETWTWWQAEWPNPFEGASRTEWHACHADSAGGCTRRPPD